MLAKGSSGNTGRGRWQLSLPWPEPFRRAFAGGLVKFAASVIVSLCTLICLIPPHAVAQFPSIEQAPGTSSSHTVHKGMPTVTDDPLATGTDNTQLTPRQRQYILRANFEKSKSDAAELAALAKQVREELNKPSVQGLSLEALARIDKIERLAKKIRDETKGF